jgi:glucosamine-6-phosphate deaminase
MRQELYPFALGPWERPGTGSRGSSVLVYGSSAAASLGVAREMADLIRARAQRSEKAVLGLATGSASQGIYDELVRLHREEGMSFRNVVTFNLDEYWPMKPNALQSYRRFTAELYDRLGLPEYQAIEAFTRWRPEKP